MKALLITKKKYANDKLTLFTNSSINCNTDAFKIVMHPTPKTFIQIDISGFLNKILI